MKTTKKKSDKKRRGNHEGSIFQIGPNKFRGAIILGKDPHTGKEIRKWVTRSSRGDVATAFLEFKDNAKTGAPLSPEKRTLATFLQEWLEVHIKPNRAYSTWRGYEQICRSYIEPNIGEFPLERLSGNEVQRCLNKLTKSGLSPTTAKNANAVLKSALTTARKWGYVKRNNAAKDATPPKQVKFKPNPLTGAQGDALLKSVVGHRFEALFCVALMMGLRRSEVCALRWSDFEFSHDYTSAMVTITSSLQRVKGKGMQLMDVKSESSHARLPVPKLCIDALLRRQMVQEQERVDAGKRYKRDGDFVFTSIYGSRIMIEQPGREFKLALRSANLPDIRFHDLRHSTASILISKRTPLKVIQAILRHSNYQITADTYSHLLPTELDDAMNTMNDVFAEATLQATDLAGVTSKKAQTVAQNRCSTKPLLLN